jgi:hypothetical protein
MNHRLLRDHSKVIAVERDIQSAYRHILTLDLFNALRKPLGEEHTAVPDTDKAEFRCTPVFF